MTDDLISRQAAKEAVCCMCRWEDTGECDECEHPIDDLPTIDPVKHELSGEWVPIEMRYGFGCGIFDCTICHNTAEIPVENGSPVYKFCPHCGARMNE